MEKKGTFSNSKIKELNISLLFFRVLVPKLFFFLFLVKRDKNGRGGR